MSGDSSFDHLSDLEPEVISRSESVEPEEDARLKELLAMIETLTLENNQLKMMHQMESLRIQEQESSEVKFKALLEEETEKNHGFLDEIHHLKEEIQSMYTYCDVLDGELSKLKAEPISANALQLEELCASQKQTIAKLEQELEVVSNARNNLRKEIESMFTYCDVLNGELRELKAEPIFANVLQLEELFTSQKQTIAKLEQELEVVSNAQKSRSEKTFVGGFQPPKKVKHVCRWLNAVVPLDLEELDEKAERLSSQERLATLEKLIEQCQPPNSLWSKFNGEWKYITSQCSGTMEKMNFESQFENSTKIYELTGTHFIVKSKRNGIYTVENTHPLNEDVVSGGQKAKTMFNGFGIQTDIFPKLDDPQVLRVIRIVVDGFLVLGISSGNGSALVVFEKC